MLQQTETASFETNEVNRRTQWIDPMAGYLADMPHGHHLRSFSVYLLGTHTLAWATRAHPTYANSEADGSASSQADVVARHRVV